MANYGPPLLNFEPIGNLADTFFGAQDKARRRRLEDLTLQGENDWARMQAESLNGGGAPSVQAPSAPMAPGAPAPSLVSAPAPAAPAYNAQGNAPTFASMEGASPTGGIGKAKSPYEIAATQVGKREVPDRAALQDYLKTGGANLDPATLAWCAAFVNASLGQAGIKGTGSNMARSFLNFGSPVDQPQKGDIAVFTRGDPKGPYGHVGFFDSFDENGRIRVLGGNQGNAVSLAAYDPSGLLGFRRVPSQAQGSTAAAQAAVPGSGALGLIRKFEDYRDQPYPDGGAYRVGYGSDTVTDPQTGEVRKVQPGMRIDRASAEADLARRIPEFQQTIARQTPAFARLPENIKAGLTSVAYNYGSLPESVVAAVNTGDVNAIASAVEGLSGDNNGINARRRTQEAAYIRNGGAADAPAPGAQNAQFAIPGQGQAPQVASAPPAISPPQIEIPAYVREGLQHPNPIVRQRAAVVAQKYVEAKQEMAVKQWEMQERRKWDLYQKQENRAYESGVREQTWGRDDQRTAEQRAYDDQVRQQTQQRDDQIRAGTQERDDRIRTATQERDDRIRDKTWTREDESWFRNTFREDERTADTRAYQERTKQQEREDTRFELIKGKNGTVTGMFDKVEKRMLSPEELQQRGVGAQQAGAGTSTENFDDEEKLRTSFNGITKDYREIEGAFTRLKASVPQTTASGQRTDEIEGPGDIALIFNYMKMLDPGSVVREGEFATAQNSGGIGEKVRSMYNGVLSGAKLSPALRAEIVGKAEQIYGAETERFNQHADEYRGLAESYGFQPDRIVRRREAPAKREPTRADGASGPATPAPQYDRAALEAEARRRGLMK